LGYDDEKYLFLAAQMKAPSLFITTT